MKTEISENIPSSLPPIKPVNLGCLFREMNLQMQKIETFSNKKIQSLETENNNLQKENERLKKLLAAKERDYDVYYNQYQNIAIKYEELKSKFDGTNKTTIEDKNVDNSEIINESRSEPLLFTTPDATNESTAVAIVPSIDANSSIQDSETPKTRVIAKATSRKRPRESDSPRHTTRMGTIRTPTQFKCSICLKENEKVICYDNIDDYRNHIIQCHPKQQFLCAHCPYHSFSYGNLQRHHQSVHKTSIDGVGFDCSLCNISYLRVDLLKQHIKRYH